MATETKEKQERGKRVSTAGRSSVCHLYRGNGADGRRDLCARRLRRKSRNGAASKPLARTLKNVKVGDQILFDKYSGSKLKIEDEDCLILKEEDILGVFTNA